MVFVPDLVEDPGLVVVGGDDGAGLGVELASFEGPSSSVHAVKLAATSPNSSPSAPRALPAAWMMSCRTKASEKR